MRSSNVLGKLRSMGARLACGFFCLVLIIAGFGWMAKSYLHQMEFQVEILWEEWLEAFVLDEVSSSVESLSRILAETRGLESQELQQEHRDRLERVQASLRAVDWAAFLDSSHAEGEANPDHEREELAIQSKLEEGVDDLVEVLELALADLDTGGTIDASLILPTSHRVQESLQRIRALDQREAKKAWAKTEANLARIHRTLDMTSVGAVLLAILLSVLIYRSVRSPLQGLRKVVSRYADGHFEERSHFDTPDEIGELSRDLNLMAEQLNAAYAALEEKVEQKTAELLQSSKMAGIGTLASGIAHEVNNPLNTIASCAEGLRKRIASVVEERRALFDDYLRIIAEETSRASGIARGLLDFAGEKSLKHSSLDVGTLLAQVIEITMPRARVLGVDLDLVIRDESNVHGDGGKLRQVFFNLLQNALEASERGQCVRIEVARAPGGQIEISVADEGAGMDREQIRKIYDPFFTTKQDSGGTGLGLSVCYGIIDEHGGHIEAESEGIGRGSTFRVLLPATQTEEVRA